MQNFQFQNLTVIRTAIQDAMEQSVRNMPLLAVTRGLEAVRIETETVIKVATATL
ncbi:MAG: hypothetical protein WAO76_08765 [Georgfuchsia sp.]